MNRISLILAIYLLFISHQALSSGPVGWPNLPLNERQKAHIENDRILVFSQMENVEKASEDEKERGKQQWDFSIYGLHPQSCRIALRRLSRYEEYDEYINFISQSKYDESEQRLHFRLESQLLPFTMILAFKLPRIKSPGSYPYEFDRGFLSGLEGKIHISEHKQRCLFYSTAHWEGPHTGIPNFIFQAFSQALAKMAMERLFRISNT